MLCPDECFSYLFSFKKRLGRRQRRKSMDNKKNNSNSISCSSSSGALNDQGSRNNNDIHEASGDHETLDNSGVKTVPVLTSSSSSPQINVNPLHEWMKRARRNQQSHYNSLGDRVWDFIEKEEMLEMKIGFALFGVPTIIKNGDNNSYSLGYNNDQVKQINDVKCHITSLWQDIKSNSNHHSESLSIYFACIFVYLRLKDDDNKEGADVLFRIPKVLNKNLDEYLFVDANCRTYVDWNDYLINNKLPKCHMCYPLNGIYETHDGIVEIGFKKSPRWKLTKSILTGLDFTSTVLSLGATGVSVAALAVPVAAPFIWGATATILASGAYDISRHVNNLIDIKKHHESLSLKNPTSRGAWIGLAATAVGAASVGGAALSRGFLASEQVIGRTGAITLRIINMSSIAINGVGVLNSLITIVMKYLNGSLEKDDLLQFSSACYFFLNAIVSLKIVNRLIKDVASSDINDIFHTTKNSIYSFTKTAIEFTESHQYQLLRELVLGSQLLLIPGIDLGEIDMIIGETLSLINRLSSGTLTWADFAIELSQIWEIIWSKFRHVIMHAIEEFCQIFEIKDWRHYVVKSNYKPFAQASPDNVRHLCMVVHKTIGYCELYDSNTEYINDIFNLIIEFNIHSLNENSVDFINRTKFICDTFKKEFDSLNQDYEFNLDLMKSNLKPNEGFDLNNFNMNYGIEGDRHIYFFKKALSKLRSDKLLTDMNSSYQAISNDESERSFNNAPCMETNISSHYIFSGPYGRSVLTEHHYYQELNDITNCGLNKDNSTFLSQENLVLIRPNDENHHIYGAIFYSTYEKGCVMGLLTILKKQSP